MPVKIKGRTYKNHDAAVKGSGMSDAYVATVERRQAGHKDKKKRK